MIMTKVTDLRTLDMVDLAGDRYADPQGTVDIFSRFHQVVGDISEESGWLAVECAGWGTICFPPHHVIAVVGRVTVRA